MFPSLLVPIPKSPLSYSYYSSYLLSSYGHYWLAMIQTMSGSPNDHWLQFYHQDFPNQTLSPDQYANTTTNATTVTTAVLPPETMNPSSPTSSTHMGPEGRVSKPTRRRSRASRRTPTTLLNTDTTNFRAMVQQFTGGPVAPFASPSPSLSLASTTPGFSALAGFGLGPRASTSLNNQTLVSAPFYQHLQQQQNLYQAQVHNQHYNNMYNSGNNTQGGGEERFFERLMSPPNNNAVTDHHHIRGQGGEGGEGGGFFPNTSSS